MLDSLIVVGYIALFFVLPFGLGAILGSVLRVKEYSVRMGFVMFTIGLGCAPFVIQIARGHSWQDALSYGIDLAGGTNLIYQLEDQKDREPLDGDPKAKSGGRSGVSVNDQLMNQMVSAVSRRINPAGTKEVTVRRVGRDRIEVIIPGANPAAVEDAKQQMTQLGSLEFSIVANVRDHKDYINRARSSPAADVRAGGKVVAAWRELAPDVDENGKQSPQSGFDADPEIAVRQMKGRPEGFKEVLVLVEPDENKRITGKLLKTARAGNDSEGRPAVHFTFNIQGASLFQNLTMYYRPRQDGTKRKLAILLDGKVHSAPYINDVISATGQITGKFTEKEVNNLVGVLNAGALPVPLKKDPISEFTISPTLGLDVQSKGKLALWVSTLSVVLFMGVYYLVAGLVADFAMILNLLFIVSVMAFIEAAFTLPGLAGLVLSAGMAVDANVLIYERIREETQRGASLRMAIHNGFDRALTAIVDSNVVTLITAVILFMIGTDQVRGFAVSLFIGLVMNLFTAVYVSRVILDVFERTRITRKLKMLRLIGVTHFDFVGKQFIATAASLVLITAGMVALFVRGSENLDIDFTGGTMVTMQFTESQNSDDVRHKLEKTFGSNITVEELKIAGQKAAGTRFRLRTTNDREEEIKELVNQTFPNQLVRKTMTPGPIEVIPGAPAASDKEKTPASPVDELFGGGHQVKLAFSDEISPVTIESYLVKEFARQNRPQAQTLFALEGLSGTGVNEQEGRVKLFDAMRLKVVKDVPETEVAAVVNAVQGSMQNSPSFEEVTSFASAVADEAITWAIVAIVAALLAVVTYVWFRFDKMVFGLSAVVALIHDVLVSLGAVALGAYLSRTPLGPMLLLTDFKINMPMIAAFLTIVGYSLNDTIVIFDRLREIRGKNPDVTKDMINLTVNQCLSRTLLTAFTVFISVAILYALGGDGIHGFAFCMVIGSIAGTYSTVYIASPLVLWFMRRSQQNSSGGRTPAKKVAGAA